MTNLVTNPLTGQTPGRSPQPRGLRQAISWIHVLAPEDAHEIAKPGQNHQMLMHQSYEFGQHRAKHAAENKDFTFVPHVSSYDDYTISDDALRVATSMRRSSKLPVGARCNSHIVVKAARMHVNPNSTFTAAHEAHAQACNTASEMSEMHLEAYTIPAHMKSTADLAVSASTKLSTKPISEGGLGPYFLTEVFRRSALEDSLDGALQNVPVSSHVIAGLSIGKCRDPSACCSICLMHFTSEVVTLPCAHVFHEKCITPWLQRHNSCPCCRVAVESSSALCPAWMSLSKQSRSKRRKFSARELALRVSQWDGMSLDAVATFAKSAETLVPASTPRSAVRSRKRTATEENSPYL